MDATAEKPTLSFLLAKAWQARKRAQEAGLVAMLAMRMADKAQGSSRETRRQCAERRLRYAGG